MTLNSKDFGSAGNQSVLEAITAGVIRRIAANWQNALDQFVRMRDKYLLYK